MTKWSLASGTTTCFCLVFLFSACVAKRLPDGFLAYNEAVRVASDREILLNIVRLRYFDSLEFLSIASINSTVSFSVGVNASDGTIVNERSASYGSSIGYSTTPTFSFVPHRGIDFASRLTEPTDIGTLVYLTSANRDAHLIFRLLVTSMNGLYNQEGIVDRHFIDATQALTALQVAGTALLGFRAEEEIVSPAVTADQVNPSVLLQALSAGFGIREQSDGSEIVFTKNGPKAILYVAEDAPSRVSVLERLRLDPTRVEYPIRLGVPVSSDVPGELLVIRTRSLLQAMAFLSHGVDVPADHLAAGIASSDWPHASVDAVPMDDLFRVWYSTSRPDDASTAVKHRGYWFYIRDNDSTSKRTFFLITEAFRLTLEHNAEKAPVLTLGVRGAPQTQSGLMDRDVIPLPAP